MGPHKESLRGIVGTGKGFKLMMRYSLLIGLLLGESAWALNYWRLSALAGGMTLLLIFYVIVGVVQQALLNRLTRRTLIEFVAVTTVTFILILRLNG